MKPFHLIRPEAVHDLDEQVYYIALRSLDASKRLQEATYDVYRKLAEMPELGAVVAHVSGQFTGVRVWAVPGFRNHLVFYRPVEGGIEVLRILHGAQDWQAIVGN